LSFVILFLGGLAIKTLPTSQFPEIAPPVVMVSASYPGASAKSLAESVIIPLEQSINGAWGMRYMTSDATSAERANIQVVFNPGTDINQALVQVSNRGSAGNQSPSHSCPKGRCGDYACDSQYVDVCKSVQQGQGCKHEVSIQLCWGNMIPEIQRINGIGQARILGSPAICHAGLVESRPHAGL
jgi:HAE1 family hydrophobic/amphiphilic exporter-1